MLHNRECIMSKNRPLKGAEKDRHVAYHEAGHAIVCIIKEVSFDYTSAKEKITKGCNKRSIDNYIKATIALAGKASEEHFFNGRSMIGSLEDIESAKFLLKDYQNPVKMFEAAEGLAKIIITENSEKAEIIAEKLLLPNIEKLTEQEVKKLIENCI